MGTDICLPVAKYSHATGLNSDNGVNWTHLASSNLFVIVKGTDKTFKDEKLMLRIVQANDVLESLDVSSYTDEALKVRRSAQNADKAIYMEQLPVFGITKDTIVALRYTLHDGQARRLQMRMHTAAQCRQVVHALESRGMEFKEQRPGTARPGTARPLTTSSHLVTPQPSSPYFNAAAQPARHPFTPQVIEAGSLSQAYPQSPERLTSSFEQELTGSRGMPPPKLFARDETFAPREVAPNQPSTAQVYRSQTFQPPPSEFDGDDIVHQAHKSGFARPSSTSNTAGADAISQEVSQHQSPPHPGVNATSFLALNETAAFHSAVAAGNLDSTSNHLARPARPTTSSSFVFPETLEHEIPPRRELPFPRPDSRRNGGKSTASRPRSALTLPPLPKPRLSPQDSMSSGSKDQAAPRPLSSARPHTSSPLKRSFVEVDKQASGVERPSTASPSKMNTTAHTRVLSPQAPAKKPSRMEELLEGRKTSLEKSSVDKSKRTDSLADAPGEQDEAYLSRDPSAGKPPDRRDSMSPTRRPSTEQDPTVNACAAISSTARGNDSLKQYAEQSLEDRQAALDEFMVQNIENPNFMKLCKDVENCWRRIALGL